MTDLPPPLAGERTLVRAALTALHHACAAVRRHPAGHRVRQDALRQFATRTLAAMAGRSLRLDLVGHEVQVDGNTVWADTETDDLVARLTRIGIGQLTLTPGITAATLTAFAELLAVDAPHSGPDDDLATRWQRLALDGIELGAAVHPTMPPSPRVGRTPWAALPPPGPAAVALEPAVAHELAANLPVIAARWLLADLEASTIDPVVATPRLTALIETLLVRREVSGCAWLVDAVQQHPSLAPETALEDRKSVV